MMLEPPGAILGLPSFHVPPPERPASDSCSRCGAKLPADGKFCTACGQAVTQDAQALPGAPPGSGLGPLPSPAVPQWGQVHAQRVQGEELLSLEPGMTAIGALRFFAWADLVVGIVAAIVIWATMGAEVTSIVLGAAVLVQGFFGCTLFLVIATMAENLIAIRKNTAPKADR